MLEPGMATIQIDMDVTWNIIVLVLLSPLKQSCLYGGHKEVRLSLDIGSMNIMKLSLNISFTLLLPSRHSPPPTPYSCTVQRLD